MARDLPEYASGAELEKFALDHALSLNEAVRIFLRNGNSLEQFRRNQGLLSQNQQASLLDLPIFLAGCGGLGGEMAAHLAQMGAGNLVLCDFDAFEESNLNRQRFCDRASLGRPKAEVAAKALAQKSPWGRFTPLIQKITPENLPAAFQDSALIIDCLDSVPGKRMLQDAALRSEKPWLHGAVLEHEGFARLEKRPSGFLDKLYGEAPQEKGAGPVLSHVVGGTAALMCSLFVKWLRDPDYSSPLLHVDFSIPELESFAVD